MSLNEFIVLCGLSELKHVFQADLGFAVELRVPGEFWSPCFFFPSARNIGTTILSFAVLELTARASCMPGQPSANRAACSPYPLFLFLIHFMFMTVWFVYVCTLCTGACRGQKRTLDLLELVVSQWGWRCWDLNPGPLSGQSVLLTSKLFL